MIATRSIATAIIAVLAVVGPLGHGALAAVLEHPRRDGPGDDPVSAILPVASRWSACDGAAPIECAWLEVPLHRRGHPRRALDRLLARLGRSPVPSAGSRPVTQSDAYEAITGSLRRGDVGRRRLLVALEDAADGQGGALLAVADEVRAAFEATGLDLGTFMAISCADSGAYWRGLDAAAVKALTKRIRRVALLDRSKELTREAVQRQAGHVVKDLGDGLMAVFPAQRTRWRRR